MTNAEYFEKNDICFADAMSIFNKQKNKKGGFKSFDKFLEAAYDNGYKFKPRDIVVLQLNATTKARDWKHNVVFEINSIDIKKESYVVTILTPHEGYGIGNVVIPSSRFIDENCVLY